MDKVKNFILGLDFKSILIIGLIILILLMRMCSGGDQSSHPIIKVDGKKYELLKHTIDTVTVIKTKVEYRPGKTIFKDPPIYITPPTQIDSLAVVKEYYSKIVYKDTLNLFKNTFPTIMTRARTFITIYTRWLCFQNINVVILITKSRFVYIYTFRHVLFFFVFNLTAVNTHCVDLFFDYYI